MQAIIYLYKTFWVLNASARHSFVQQFNTAMEQGGVVRPAPQEGTQKASLFARRLSLKQPLSNHPLLPQTEQRPQQMQKTCKGPGVEIRAKAQKNSVPKSRTHQKVNWTV